MPLQPPELPIDRVIDARVAIVGTDRLLTDCLGRNLTTVGATLVGTYPRPHDVPLSVLADPIVLAIDPLVAPPHVAIELVDRHPRCAALLLRVVDGSPAPPHERVGDVADVETIAERLQQLWVKVRPEGRDRRGKQPLTMRQLQLLQLVADGFTTSEIAHKVGVTSKTVNNHLGAVYRRLGTRNLTHAVLRAARLGLVRLP